MRRKAQIIISIIYTDLLSFMYIIFFFIVHHLYVHIYYT